MGTLISTAFKIELFFDPKKFQSPEIIALIMLNMKIYLSHILTAITAILKMCFLRYTLKIEILLYRSTFLILNICNTVPLRFAYKLQREI